MAGGNQGNGNTSKHYPAMEGYVRKGGTNPSTSQVQTRPAAPAPIRPATSQGGNGSSGSQESSGSSK